jgi:hypothetical protein
MNKNYQDNSESNISNTEVSGSLSLDRILDISAKVKHGTPIFPLKPNKTSLIRLGGSDFVIIRVLKDGSVRYAIYENNAITRGEL